MGKIAFWAAVLSFSLFLLTIIVGGATFPGYSHASQYISELGATGAPLSHAVSWLGFVPSGLLLMIFAVTAPQVLPRSAITWLGFAFIGYYALGLVAGGFFPCDYGCRPEDPSTTQIIHNAIAGTGYLTGITALLPLGTQARKWPGAKHLLILGVLCWLVAASALPFLDPGFEYAGFAQRTIEVCMCIWITACGYYAKRSTESRPNSSFNPKPLRGSA